MLIFDITPMYPEMYQERYDQGYSSGYLDGVLAVFEVMDEQEADEANTSMLAYNRGYHDGQTKVYNIAKEAYNKLERIVYPEKFDA